MTLASIISPGSSAAKYFSAHSLCASLLERRAAVFPFSVKKPVTLKEYIGRMKEGQEAIYYGCGRTVEAIDALPQADQFFAESLGIEVELFTWEKLDAVDKIKKCFNL